MSVMAKITKLVNGREYSSYFLCDELSFYETYRNECEFLPNFYSHIVNSYGDMPFNPCQSVGVQLEVDGIGVYSCTFTPDVVPCCCNCPDWGSPIQPDDSPIVRALKKIRASELAQNESVQ